jgi:hypothetical protein
MSEDALADLYGQGDDDTCAAILAECQRRDRADSARQVRQAVESAWYDSAFAQYLAAEQDCRGRMFSEYGQEHGPADAFGLWRLPERQALKFASEELALWWLDHPRLTFAEYKRQLARSKREERDERDLANGALERKPRKPRRPRAQWVGVKGGAVREHPVRIGDLSVAGWLATDYDGVTTIHPTREHAERMLAPVSSVDPSTMPVVDFTAEPAEVLEMLAAKREWLAQSAAARTVRVQDILSRNAARMAARNR